MTTAGTLVWKRGLRGFVFEKRPAGYIRTSDEADPVAVYPLGADEFRMSLLILEQRYPAPAEAIEPKAKLGEVAQS